jgi:hypothetical protein
MLCRQAFPRDQFHLLAETVQLIERGVNVGRDADTQVLPRPRLRRCASPPSPTGGMSILPKYEKEDDFILTSLQELPELSRQICGRSACKEL